MGRYLGRRKDQDATTITSQARVAESGEHLRRDDDEDDDNAHTDCCGHGTSKNMMHTAQDLMRCLPRMQKDANQEAHRRTVGNPHAVQVRPGRRRRGSRPNGRQRGGYSMMNQSKHLLVS
jgi:hypothetical protein